jgi:hypothetical protein
MDRPQTIIDKLWAAHEILRRDDGDSLLWVDRHYIHEGSFHAFAKLAERGAAVAEPGLTFGVTDHYVPTRGSDRLRRQPHLDPRCARCICFRHWRARGRACADDADDLAEEAGAHARDCRGPLARLASRGWRRLLSSPFGMEIG